MKWCDVTWQVIGEKLTLKERWQLTIVHWDLGLLIWDDTNDITWKLKFDTVSLQIERKAFGIKQVMLEINE